jgi:hypothetical protein
LDKALHQHKDPTTRYGKLVARLNQIAAMPYEELCDAGYLDTDRKQMVAARRSVLVEEIGEEEMNALLSDVQRITGYSLMLVQSSGQSYRSLAAQRALMSVRTISLNTSCQHSHCAAFTAPAVRIRVFSLFRGPVISLAFHGRVKGHSRRSSVCGR